MRVKKSMYVIRKQRASKGFTLNNSSSIPLLLQDLLDDATSCKKKMEAASALIEGLSGERVRWTQQSKEFQEQIGRQRKYSVN